MKKIICCILALTTVLTVFCLPAFASAVRVTPDMAVSEVMAIPEFKDNDIAPYNKRWMNDLEKNWTIGKASSSGQDESCCRALNKIAENYDKGIQVRYKIYTEVERKEDPTKENVDLYYYPASKKNQKFMIACPGGGYVFDSVIGEGLDIANQFNELGYNGFVLKYRSGNDADGNAPIKDLARAVKFVLDHARQFGINPKDYAVAGFSAGGHLVCEYGTDRWGYKNYNLPKPGLIMGIYPMICTEGIYQVFMGPLGVDNLCLENEVTDDYPNVYLVQGRDDQALNYKNQALVFDSALTRHNVSHSTHIYDHVEHGSGAGAGNDDTGWIQDAARYWEAVIH